MNQNITKGEIYKAARECCGPDDNPEQLIAPVMRKSSEIVEKLKKSSDHDPSAIATQIGKVIFAEAVD